MKGHATLNPFKTVSPFVSNGYGGNLGELKQSDYMQLMFACHFCFVILFGLMTISYVLENKLIKWIFYNKQNVDRWDKKEKEQKYEDNLFFQIF